MIKSLIFLLFPLLLSALSLEQNYQFSTHSVNATALFPELQKDFLLFEVPENRHTYRLSEKKLRAIFAKNGVILEKSHSRFINFEEVSTLDISALDIYLRAYYKKHYPSIKFHKSVIRPRSFTTVLPKEYEIGISKNSYRKSKGVFYIYEDRKARIYFDYTIDADMLVYKTAKKLGRYERLEMISVRYDRVSVDTLKRQPLASITYKRTKRPFPKDKILYENDVEALPLVKKGSNVLVSIKSAGVLIQFNAIATKDGGLFDIIAIKKIDGTRVNAKVTGYNQMELE